jgi:hypothetical protein
MKTAREEVILALASPTKQAADRHQQRAVKLLQKAVRNMQDDPGATYKWQLLRSGDE